MTAKTIEFVLGETDLEKIYAMSHWLMGSDGGELLREWVRTFKYPARWPFEGRIDIRIANLMTTACLAEIDRGTDLMLARYARSLLDRLVRYGGVPSAILQSNGWPAKPS